MLNPNIWNDRLNKQTENRNHLVLTDVSVHKVWVSYSFQEVWALNEKGNKFLLQVLPGFKRQSHNSTLHNILRKCFLEVSPALETA